MSAPNLKKRAADGVLDGFIDVEARKRAVAQAILQEDTRRERRAQQRSASLLVSVFRSTDPLHSYYACIPEEKDQSKQMKMQPEHVLRAMETRDEEGRKVFKRSAELKAAGVRYAEVGLDEEEHLLCRLTFANPEDRAEFDLGCLHEDLATLNPSRPVTLKESDNNQDDVLTEKRPLLVESFWTFHHAVEHIKFIRRSAIVEDKPDDSSSSSSSAIDQVPCPPLLTRFPRYDALQNGAQFARSSEIDEAHSMDDIYRERAVLFVSHIWESQAEPDPDNDQFMELKVLLAQNRHYAYIFYDYSSLPQNETKQDNRDPRKTRSLKVPIPGITSKETYFIFSALLSNMDDLYCGRLFPNYWDTNFFVRVVRTVCVNLCPSDLYMHRTWPYYEIFCSKLNGTLVAGPNELPILDFCTRLLKLSDSYLDFVFLRQLQQKNQGFYSHRVMEFLDSVSRRAHEKLKTVFQSLVEKEVEAKQSRPYETAYLALAGSEPPTLPEYSYRVPSESKQQSDPENYYKELMDWICDGHAYCVDQQAPLHNWVDMELTREAFMPVVQAILGQGLKYALLSTNVTNKSDQEQIIRSLMSKSQDNARTFLDRTPFSYDEIPGIPPSGWTASV